VRFQPRPGVGGQEDRVALRTTAPTSPFWWAFCVRSLC